MADEYDLGATWADFENNGRDCGPVTSSSTPQDLATKCHPKPIYGRCNEAPPFSPPPFTRACLDEARAWPMTYDKQMSAPISPAPAVDRVLGGVSSSRGVAVGVAESRGGNVMACSLCRTNGELATVYTSHRLKDSSGRVTCPVLYAYRCTLCGATGSRAHTIKYCPLQSPGATSVVKQLKTTRNSAGHRRQ